jgi:NADPH:quinone reductase-like Zn-dependent oxidoreductase
MACAQLEQCGGTGLDLLVLSLPMNSTQPVRSRPLNLMARQVRLQGLIVGGRKHQTEFIRAIEATGIKPVVDRSFGLDEIADAFRYEAGGHHFGKICLEF